MSGVQSVTRKAWLPSSQSFQRKRDEMSHLDSLVHSALATSTTLYDRANALQILFQESGQIDDLDEEVSLHREALKLRPGSYPD